MPRGQDFDLKRCYRRSGAFVGRPERRQRRSRRRASAALVVVVVALLVVSVVASIRGAHQPEQQPISQGAPDHQ